MYDVIVVGSGPSGAVASFLTSKMGYKTLLLEKAKLPRPKLCAGGLSSRACEKLSELGISHQPIYSRKITRGKLCLNDNEVFVIPGATGYTVQRDIFDNYLCTVSCDEGTDLHDNTIVKKINEKKGYVEVFTNNQRYTSSFVIGADGIHSIVRKCINAHLPIKNMGFALQTEIPLSENEISEKYPDFIVVDMTYHINGYAYIFPKKNSLAIGYCCEAKDSKHIKEILIQYLKKHAYRATKIRGSYLPYSGIADKTCTERTMLIGDAAGFCNPMQGGGIYTAIRSAELAATTINNVFQEEQTIAYYKQLWKREIGRDMSERVLGLRKRLYRHKEKVIEIISKDRWCNSLLGQIMAGQIGPGEIFSSKYLIKFLTRPQLFQILVS
jgi:geranylgeranyl reductase family protein